MSKTEKKTDGRRLSSKKTDDRGVIQKKKKE
jgi:hypothetical protein